MQNSGSEPLYFRIKTALLWHLQLTEPPWCKRPLADPQDGWWQMPYGRICSDWTSRTKKSQCHTRTCPISWLWSLRRRVHTLLQPIHLSTCSFIRSDALEEWRDRSMSSVVSIVNGVTSSSLQEKSLVGLGLLARPRQSVRIKHVGYRICYLVTHVNWTKPASIKWNSGTSVYQETYNPLSNLKS